MEEIRLARLEEKIKAVGENMDEVKLVLKDIASSLKSLAILEERHNTSAEAIKRAFVTIDKHGERLDSIEKALPLLEMASGWLFGAVICVMGILGVAAIGTVIKGLF